MTDKVFSSATPATMFPANAALRKRHAVMLSRLTHDMNNSLAALRRAAEALQSGCSAEAESAKSIGVITQELSRLNVAFSILGWYGYAEIEDRRPDLEPVEIKPLLAELAEEVAGSYPSVRVKCLYRPPVSTMWAVPEVAREMLAVLLHLAAWFLPQRRKTITVEVRGEPERQRVAISVPIAAPEIRPGYWQAVLETADLPDFPRVARPTTYLTLALPRLRLLARWMGGEAHIEDAPRVADKRFVFSLTRSGIESAR
jgi:signal transduction histidine kinase